MCILCCKRFPQQPTLVLYQSFESSCTFTESVPLLIASLQMHTCGFHCKGLLRHTGIVEGQI
jgi:hypothetical protein